MASASQIEWTDVTWNPVTGCSKVSQGCKHCYAERMAKRLKAMRVDRYRNGFQVALHEDLLDAPKRWRSPRMVFVNSMSDLFHDDVPASFVQRIFRTMEDCPQHTFQILTKRSERLLALSRSLPWPRNVWMGVSVESRDFITRIRDLQGVSASVRFLSCEPLLGPLPRLPLAGIRWVIVGGESGPGARPMEKKWVLGILRQCRRRSVPFFFKQWGGVNKKRQGRRLDGRTYDEMPMLAVEMPTAGQCAA